MVVGVFVVCVVVAVDVADVQMFQMCHQPFQPLDRNCTQGLDNDRQTDWDLEDDLGRNGKFLPPSYVLRASLPAGSWSLTADADDAASDYFFCAEQE